MMNLLLPLLLTLTPGAVGAAPTGGFRAACAEALGRTKEFVRTLRDKADRLRADLDERLSRAEEFHETRRRGRDGARFDDIAWVRAMDRKIDYALGLIAHTFTNARLRGLFNARAVASQAEHRTHRHQALDEGDVRRMIQRTIAKYPTAHLWAYELPAPLALFVEGRALPRIFLTGTVVVMNADLVVDASPMLDLKAKPFVSNARDIVPTP